MSKILRRPMFRGGPVDSRGTGITSGLGYEAGGRVGYSKGNFVTGGELMSLVNSYPELNMYKDSKFNKFTKYNLNDPNQRADVLRIGSFAGTAGMQDLAFGNNYSLSDSLAALTGDKKEDDNILIASKDTEDLKIGKKEDEIDMDKSFDIESVTSEDAYKSPTMTMKEKEFSGEIDSTPDMTLLETEDPQDEPKIEDPDTIIKEQADKYFELMGGGKAFSRDVGDMALRFAGAEGNTVAEKLQNYFRDESKAGPSRTEKLKGDAAKVAINYQTQKEFLEKKLANAKDIAEKNIIAQSLRDLNKTYAPGITKKKLDTLKSLDPNSKDYKLALADFGLATSFDAQVYKDMNSNQPLTVETADTYASIYYPNYKGIATADSKSGMFLDVANKRLIILDDTGEITPFKTLQIQ